MHKIVSSVSKRFVSSVMGSLDFSVIENRPNVPLPGDRLSLQDCLEPNCFRTAKVIIIVYSIVEIIFCLFLPV